ncbi:unnamed protein product [Urochloa decumbens]|uniref:DUF4220 domain-containing protein n=1 Tax=Urochloa decumbens TaxID=240449 RepID=A0ABC9BVH1_9POAL
MPQVTIAIYVFVKSWWFHDQRLLRASILLFVPGVIKCLEKPWALRNATATSIADSSDPQMAITMEEEEDATPPTGNSLDGYVRAARKCVDDEATRDLPLCFDDKMNDEPYHLFVDLAQPYSVRLKNLQIMAVPSGRAEAHGRVRAGISRGFDRLYTKHKASYGGVLRAAVVILTFADIGLFEATRRRLADQLDLLWCTAPHQPTRRVTELVHDHVAGGWKGVASVADYHRFNDSRGQRSLRGGGLGHLEWSLRMPFDESVLVWHLGTELCYFNHVWHARVISNYMTYLLFARPWMLIFRAVYIELREMLKEEEMSELEDDDDDEAAAAKRKSSPTAMDGIARKIIQKLRNPPTSSHPRQSDRTLSADLIRKAWALAYELMEFATKKTQEFIEEDRKKPPTEEEKRKAAAVAAAEAEKWLTAEEKEAAEQRRKKEEEEARANRAKNHGDERMWEVIQGMWVEMLCFSAARCRGNLHARSLGEGGEYLSHVWLLLSYMGMETRAERMQRMAELAPVEGDVGALVKTSNPDDDEEDDQPAAQGRPAAPPGAAGTASATVALAAMAVSVSAVEE